MLYFLGTNIMQITNHTMLPPTPDNISDNTSSQSLEDKVKELYAQYSVEVKNKKQQLIIQGNSLDVSNPVEMLKMQDAIGQYALELNFVSTLTHKATNAIDTLLKAQ